MSCSLLWSESVLAAILNLPPHCEPSVQISSGTSFVVTPGTSASLQLALISNKGGLSRQRDVLLPHCLKKITFCRGGGVWHGCSFWELTSLNKVFIRAICFVGWRCITVNKRDRFQRRLTGRPWKIIRKQLIYIYAGEPMQNHSLRSLSAPTGAQELFTWSTIMCHCFLAVPGAQVVQSSHPIPSHSTFMFERSKLLSDGCHWIRDILGISRG